MHVIAKVNMLNFIAIGNRRTTVGYIIFKIM